MKQQFGTYDLVLRSGVDPTTGGVAICGFTTAGMVGVIAASHIIESLNLTQLGTVMDENFPAVAFDSERGSTPPCSRVSGRWYWCLYC